MSFQMSRDSEMIYRGSTFGKEILDPDCPPIWHSTACRVADMDDYDFANNGGKYYYNRTAAPNRDMLGDAVSFMESGEASIITSSGMAAISTTLLTNLKTGDHILSSKSIYGETIELMDGLLKNMGIVTDYADFTDLDDVRAHITPETKILYTEIISNPLIRVTDIDAISAMAKEIGALTVVDNTFSTPFVIRPLEHGADIVIHSLTKFFGGHSDITGGSITASKAIIDRMNPNFLLLGGCMDPNTAWLALRSIRTMKLRVERQMENAAKLADALSKDGRVRYVNYPTLSYHPQHALAERLLTKGCGPMLSFRVEDSRDKVNAFIRALSMVQYLGTLGGYRTSLAHPATAFRNEFTPEQLKAMGLQEGLIRISVGIEEPEDIIGDIVNALSVFDA
ncbi:MAG: aminotransferase class I/II-fold pyridoxal phosphate-dependent enzyme [Lachnospiraceae bacterium]|nr:aminotransferase class I/II-fold pyridoxal phosphate-dependent enzyme [Lachnospiraceae bacterium]